MNRVEIVGLFTALKVLVKEKNMDGIEEIVDAVLDEAQIKKKKAIRSSSEKTED